MGIWNTLQQVLSKQLTHAMFRLVSIYDNLKFNFLKSFGPFLVNFNKQILGAARAAGASGFSGSATRSPATLTRLLGTVPISHVLPSDPGKCVLMPTHSSQRIPLGH